jgi:hypothetical protein
MTLYSQRDPRWSSIFLGDNTAMPYTIGNYGCLITCLSSYIDKEPTQVNELLKNNKAFVSGGLFVWSKSVVLGLNQTYVSPRYEGLMIDQGLARMTELLDQGYPLLCEVDFNPNTSGEEMHFVLIVRYEGDSFYAMDPWVGQIINLSVYGGIKRAAIQFRAYDKKLKTTPPVTSTPISSGQSMQQIIIDCYRALCGQEPTEDEINYRLKQQINTYDLISDICQGDTRFKRQWENVGQVTTSVNDSVWEAIKRFFGR